MKLQKVLADRPETLFWEPSQDAIGFPQSLAEKYQPTRPQDFIGLDRVKTTLINLAAKPRPSALIFTGPPGAGKSAMAMAFAESLPGSLHHVTAQKCDVAALEDLNTKFAYSPPNGAWWVCLVDEGDGMTEKAQLQLLSRLDGTAGLKPEFGGGFKRGTPPPVIWIFTGNGRGPDQTEPPPGYTPRFLSRCMLLPFPAAPQDTLSAYLRHVWRLEGGGETPDGYFDYMAVGVGVRDALMRLESDLLAGCRPKPAPPAAIHIVTGHERGGKTTTGREAALKAWATRRARTA